MLSIALIGARFMGRAHSNAWSQAGRFFELPAPVRLAAVCARDAEATAAFAARWGWAQSTTDLADIVGDETIDLVDVCTPNHVHAVQAIAALEAGKHVACEKPLAGTLAAARVMRDAAQAADGSSFVWFNYRRCPAIAQAWRMVREGDLGRIHHVRAHYLQDWGGPDTPRLWRFDAAEAGSGAHGDLNAHIIDLARFLTGDEIIEVSGAIAETFVTERPDPDGGPPLPSTVDDAVLFLARFASGAIASFEASRVATGHQNRNCIELNGERGSIRFDFERMNELQWWDHTLDPAKRGWSRILCTTPGVHPYAEAYWPPAHPIGYEHGFVSQAADIVAVLHGRKPVVPLADFADAYQTQRVLEAAMLAARERQAISLDDVQ